MQTLRSVSSFQIRTIHGQILSGSIEELDILENFLVQRGMSDTAKISFYISDTERPFEFCNIILRNDDEFFVPEFCEKNQPGDWDLIMQVLTYGNLDDLLVEHILIS